MTRSELKAQAKAALSGNWGIVLAATLVNALIVSVLSTITASLSNVVVIGPLAVGMSAIVLTALRGGKPTIEQLFSGFQTCFVPALIASLIVTISVALGSLLLMIPGLILSMMFSQVFYILADHPGMTGKEAIKTSSEMMKGHKGELFVLILSFFPWMLLSMFVLPLLYVIPYMTLTMGAYYEYVSGGPVITDESYAYDEESTPYPPEADTAAPADNDAAPAEPVSPIAPADDDADPQEDAPIFGSDLGTFGTSSYDNSDNGNDFKL